MRISENKYRILSEKKYVINNIQIRIFSYANELTYMQFLFKTFLKINMFKDQFGYLLFRFSAKISARVSAALSENDLIWFQSLTT